MKNALITLATAVVVIALTILFVEVKSIRANIQVGKIEVGDTFKVTMHSQNPFEEHLVFGGRIIDKCGNYVKYVDFDGDTASTNIRDSNCC